MSENMWVVLNGQTVGGVNELIKSWLFLIGIIQWATIQLRVSLCALRSVCRSLLDELRRSNLHVTGLSIAAAISDRLQALFPEANRSVGTQNVDRAQMYSEAARRETFLMWPHMDYK